MQGTFNVRMPDGTMIRNIPEGTPREEIARRYSAMTGKAAPSTTADPEAVKRAQSANPIVQAQAAKFPAPEKLGVGFGPDTTLENDALKAISDVGIGLAVKGPLKTALGVSQLLNRASGGRLGVPPSVTQEDVGIAPTNTAQRVGQTVEQIGEFFVPGGAVAKGGKAVEALKIPAALKTVGKAAMEGVAAGGVAAAQTGSPTTGAVAGATAATFSAAIPMALKAMGSAAEKIETTLIKPTIRDSQNGFKARNVFKHRVGGTLEQTARKTQTKIDALVQEAKTIRDAGTAGVVPAGAPAGPTVNLKDALIDAANELKAKIPKHYGSNSPIEKALIDNVKEFDHMIAGGFMSKTGDAPINVAHEVLQAVGRDGAWKYGMRDPASAAAERVANSLYSALRRRIEASSADGTRLNAINRDIGELIAIKQAVIRRIPVEQRNQFLHLSDIVSFASGNWKLALGNRALRSGTVARGLASASESTAPGLVAPKLGAAAAAEVVK
jgi:hypothetical protein